MIPLLEVAVFDGDVALAGVFLIDFGVFFGLCFFDGDFLAAGVFINSAMPSKLGDSTS